MWLTRGDIWGMWMGRKGGVKRGVRGFKRRVRIARMGEGKIGGRLGHVWEPGHPLVWYCVVLRIGDTKRVSCTLCEVFWRCGGGIWSRKVLGVFFF